MMNSEQVKRTIENSHSASFWLKKAVVTAEGRDVLDALYDAQALLEFCRARAVECGIRPTLPRDPSPIYDPAINPYA